MVRSGKVNPQELVVVGDAFASPFCLREGAEGAVRRPKRLLALDVFLSKTGRENRGFL